VGRHHHIGESVFGGELTFGDNLFPAYSRVQKGMFQPAGYGGIDTLAVNLPPKAELPLRYRRGLSRLRRGNRRSIFSQEPSQNALGLTDNFI
jgi:hypothetical protein